MGFQIPFQSRSTLRLPEALSEGAAARGRQKEKNENGKDKRPTSRPLPSDPRIKPLRGQAAIHHLNQAANSSLAQTTRISPAEDPYANMEPIHIREKICIKAGEMQGDDLSLILIYPMRDIDQNVEAMCERVTDLLGPGLRGEEVVLGNPFIAESLNGMSIIDDSKLCGILVRTDRRNPAKVRVADLANLKPQTEPYPVGYGEFNVASDKYWGSHVVVVKRGQQAVIEGKVKLCFFMRVAAGTDDRAARIASEDAWNFRKTVYDVKGDLWHEYFTKLL